jgi:hypothetical protein
MTMPIDKGALRTVLPEDADWLIATADREYQTRIDADRCTWQFKQTGRSIDSGRKPITESPLFGGPAQGNLFT